MKGYDSVFSIASPRRATETGTTKTPRMWRASSGDPGNAACFFVACVQVEENREAIVEPEWQRRQGRAKCQGIRPGLQKPELAATHPAAGNRVKRRGYARERRSLLAEKLDQVGVEVGRSSRDQIDDGETDPLLKQADALGDKGATVFGPILVGGTDDLDGCHQPATGLDVVDTNFIRIERWRVGGDGQRRTRWRPDHGRDPGAFG